MNRIACIVMAAGVALAAACGRQPAQAGPAAPAVPAAPAAPVTIRVGFFPNITHGQALIGMARGDFQKALGPGVTIVPTVFNAGPSVIEAIFAGQLDLACIGPNPAINGFVRSRGEALRIVAGATSGGAALVVRPDAGITAAAGLAGKRLATPQLGNTQDVALRNYLAANGLAPTEKGGTVEVIPTDNPQILDLFKQGTIHGAWVPEPWAGRLVVEGGGTVFVDERDLWPQGDFVTAHVIVATPFLKAHPEIVRAWLGAHVRITEWMIAEPAAARDLLNTAIKDRTGKALAPEVLTQAWGRLRPTWDPVASSLQASARSAFACGFLKEEPRLDGIYDLTLLNAVLKDRGLAPVAGLAP